MSNNAYYRARRHSRAMPLPWWLWLARLDVVAEKFLITSQKSYTPIQIILSADIKPVKKSALRRQAAAFESHTKLTMMWCSLP